MDARLAAAAALFPQVETGADIGANHGLLACALLAAGKAKRMWITDLSADALREARKNIHQRALDANAAFAVGDGFSALPEPVDAAAILGMGGVTLADILRRAPEDRLPERLILSSHTEQALVRECLFLRGYCLEDEQVVESGGRFYILHAAVRGSGMTLPDERTLFLGPCLIRQHSPVYRAYLARKIAAYQPSQTMEGRLRYTWLREEAARATADSQSSP